jgi:alginate O-acetyltransferase complex protein AlgJ
MKPGAIKILTVLAIVFAGFCSVVFRGGESVYAIFRTVQLKDFLSGTLSGKIDRAVFDAIPRSAALNGFAAGLLYKGLRDTGSQVWAGCNDWLYSVEELRANRHDAENIAAHAKLLPLLVQALARRGILLVVVPVPDKAEQVEDQLCGIAADQSRFRARLWTQASSATALDQADLRTRWPHPGYWRTDTHWDSTGARFAAEAVAQIINGKLGPGPERINLTSSAMHERPGDLARLAGLMDSPRWLAPAAEFTGDPRAEIQRSGGLLDDTPSPSVILAGSSFSLNSGFIEYLQASLAREVAQVSEAGGGFAGALLNILQQKPDMLATVKVVIWEWPMRSLTAPLSEAERRFAEQVPSRP